MGRSLKKLAKREDVIIATKFIPRTQEEISNGVSGQQHIEKLLGISNCYAYQLAKANALAEKEGFAKFVSVQNHYNLLFREEEREMAKFCAEDNIAMTPYSSLRRKNMYGQQM